MYRAPLNSEEIESTAPPSDSQMWDSRRARLDALKSSFELAQVVGIQLGEAHRKVIEDAVHEVLLPIGQEQADMIDAAEILRRKGHTSQEVARLSSEFGKAMKTASERTARIDHTPNCREYGALAKSVRVYHSSLDAHFIDAVYRIFAQCELYNRVCQTGNDSSCETAESVEGALKGTRWDASSSSRERSCRRRAQT